jgi:hypothetical protein
LAASSLLALLPVGTHEVEYRLRRLVELDVASAQLVCDVYSYVARDQPSLLLKATMRAG